jgi:hypothetical protein
MIASAGPGYQVTSVSVMPQNAAKVVGAFDAYFASSAGTQFKGRMILLRHVVDGTDPSTHSLVSLYHSVAELETFQNAVANDPALSTLMDTIVPVATLQSQVRTVAIRSWGDIQDSDTVWNAHYFNVTDAAGFNAALDTWLASKQGKKFPGQGHLAAINVGGLGAPTHVINVGYASQAEMESYNDSTAGSPDWAAFVQALGGISTHVGADLTQQVKAWGPATLKSLTPTQ